jgi:SAM-dependent methyltransferase
VARTEPFDRDPERYDRWFDRHAIAYRSELLAVRALTPVAGFGLEIGVGSGRFAAPLGVACGVDPSRPMLLRARERGVPVLRAVAEALPFARATFDYALIVTTICFVDDPPAMLAETRRVLKRGGAVVVGLVDRDSSLGRHYLAHQAESPFYADASFFTAADVERLLMDTGFVDPVWVETLSEAPDRLARIEPARPGRGEGAFLVVRATRS